MQIKELKPLAMPRKRQSQPMQVWLAAKDLRRLVHAAKTTGRSQSDIARQGILSVLHQIEKVEREKNRRESILQKFSTATREVVLLAKQESEISSASLIASQHILMALAVQPALGTILQKHNAGAKTLRNLIETGPNFESIYIEVEQPPYSPRVVRVFDRARSISKRLQDTWVHPEHLLLAVLDQGNGSAFDLLGYLGVSVPEIRAAVMKHIRICRKEPRWKTE